MDADFVLSHAISGVCMIAITMRMKRPRALAKLADLVEQIIAAKAKAANPIPLRFRQHDKPAGLQSTG